MDPRIPNEDVKRTWVYGMFVIAEGPRFAAASERRVLYDPTGWLFG